MRVLIALGIPYPGSSAAASRAQKLVRGLTGAGAEAMVLGQRLLPAGAPAEGVDAAGVRFGTVNVGYRSFLGRFRERNRIVRANVTAVRQLIARERFDAVIVYAQSWLGFNTSYRLLTRVRAACHEMGVACVMDCTEWHPPLSYLAPLVGIDQSLVLRLALRRLDGIMGISSLWMDYARRLGLPAVLVPALGEADAGAGSGAGRGGPLRLTYMGRLGRRDLPRTMIEGLRRAVQAGVDAHLVVVGGVAERERSSTEREAQSHPASSGRVVFTGWLADQDLRQRLAEADALLLLRDDTREARACFPTRLPEYLLTGNPVIVSNAGDMSLYLEDGVSAVLLPPGDRPDALAQAVVMLSQQPQTARRIGAGGQLAALRHFAYPMHGPGLLEFLTQRVQARRSGA